MSRAATHVINSMRSLAKARNRQLALEDELQELKASLKLAKSEVNRLLRETCEASHNEAAGIEPLFDLPDLAR